MATGNVARAVPRIGVDRGLLKAGYLADVVVATRRSPADVRLVVIDGRVALARGPVPSVGQAPLAVLCGPDGLPSPV
jgi:cytosine/adenosine deaminase-related metal-dependent hydrolase